MLIRKTRTEDFAEVMEIYAIARKFMAGAGNPTQWGSVYPPEELIREDIEQGISYVAEEDGEIEAVFMYFFGDDPTYHIIEDGNWKNTEPYGVIHRIASKGKIKGTGAKCLLWGYEQCGNLKIDTHEDNVVMQHVLEKNGFERCGKIYTHDGTPRIAYQKC